MSEEGQEPDEVESFRMPLLEHLHELRRRVLFAGGAVFLTTVLCLFLSTSLIDLLAAPIRQVMDTGQEPNQMDFVYQYLTSPLEYLPGWNWLNQGKTEGKLALVASFEGVNAYLQVALLGGFTLSSPIVAYQLWGFVAPGLYKTERRAVIPLTFASTFLFLLGAGFAYLVILPLAFRFFINIVNAEPFLSIQDAVKTVMRIMVAFGLCYQLPVVSWFLARIGLIDHRDMIKGFRYAIVGIFIVAAFITPPEVITQVMLAVPLVLLYAISIVVTRLASTKQRSAEG